MMQTSTDVTYEILIKVIQLIFRDAQEISLQLEEVAPFISRGLLTLPSH